MKKFMIPLVIVSLLSACVQEKEKTVDQSTTHTNPSESVSPTAGENQNTEHEFSDLPEYDALSKTIDLNAFTGIIETDNPGTRVLLFENTDSEKVYKSVFVKNDKMLKIIKLDSDGIVYKDYIK